MILMAQKYRFTPFSVYYTHIQCMCVANTVIFFIVDPKKRQGQPCFAEKKI